MNPTLSEPGVLLSGGSRGSKKRVWRAALLGLAPVVLSGVIVVLTLLLTALVRHLTAADDFFVQQRVSVIVVSVGLILATVVYAIATRRALKKIRAWHQAGHAGPVVGGLWALGMAAVVSAFPVLLAVFMH